MKIAFFYNLGKIIPSSLLTMNVLLFMFAISIGSCKQADPIEPQMQEANNLPKSSTGDGKVSVWSTKVMQLNLCGNMCWAADALYAGSPENRGGLAKLSKVVAAIDTYQPHIIIFNEICYSQYKKIKIDLVARGYSWGYSSTTSGSNCDNYDSAAGQGLGQAIFTKVSTDTPAALVSVKYPLTQSTEYREMLCTDLTIDGKLVKVCAVHITHVAAYRPQQIVAVANLATGWVNSGKRVIIAGDFNSQPHFSEMDPMYSHSGGTGVFQEADESNSCPAPLTACRAGERTFHEVKAFYDPPATPHKLDYIFFSAPHFGNPTGDAKSALPDPVTDHNLLQGSAPWQ